MVCPLCHQYHLLKADEKWFCPHCFIVFHHLPLYGLSDCAKYTLYGSRYKKLFSHSNIHSPGCTVL